MRKTVYFKSQDAYVDWLEPELAKRGYVGKYQAKKREPIFIKGRYCKEVVYNGSTLF